VPKLNVFNGGLSVALAPHLINASQSVVNTNMDHTPGTITPLKGRTEIDSITGAEKWGYYWEEQAEWYWSRTPKDWVEYNGRLYIGARSGTSTKIVSGVEQNLGIAAPTSVPTLVATEETPGEGQISQLTLTKNSLAGDFPPYWEIQYRAVNITAGGGVYPSENVFTIRTGFGLTESVTISCNATNISDTLKYFRLLDGVWRLVATFGPGAVAPSVFNDTVYDISANDSIDGFDVSSGPDGTYVYAYTYYNATDDTESVPILSAEEECLNGTMTVSNIVASTDPQVTHIRIYRVGGELTTFTLVEQVANATAPYVDDLKDTEIEGSLLDSDLNYPAPEDLKYLTEEFAMFFGVVGAQLRFTPIGTPDYWPLTYFLQFPTTITGIGKTPQGLLVFDRYRTWLVTGSGPLSLIKQPLSSSQGCVNPDSVVNIQGACYWASTDGVCVSNGGEVNLLTRERLDKLDLTSSVNATVYDNEYYLLTDELNLLTGEYGLTMVIGLRDGAIRYANYDIDSLIKVEDNLYGYNASASALYSLESSTTDLVYTWKSPEYTGSVRQDAQRAGRTSAGFTVPKVYKNFYVFSDGETEFSIIIDTEVVQTATLIGRDNHQIKIPTGETRGYSVQFAATGTGTIYEISWEDGNASE